MKIYKKNFLLIYGILSFLIIFAISLLFISLQFSLKNKIFNEYKDVYIENRKAHLKDVIEHIFTEIKKKKDKLYKSVKKEVFKSCNIYFNFASHLYESSTNITKEKFLSDLKNFESILANQNISLFVIDANGKYLIAPTIKINSKDLIKIIKNEENNKNYIISYKTFKPFDIIIGSIGNLNLYEKQLKTYILDNLNKYRYDTKKLGYVFVIEMKKGSNGKLKAIRLVNPNKPPSSIGKEIPIGIKDINGKKFFLEMVNKCVKKGEGYVSYKFKIPETTRIGEKITYVKYLKDLNWIIGTGFYFDIFKKQLKNRDNKLFSVIKLYSIKFIAGLILLQSLLFFLFIYYILKFLKRIETYVNTIEENERFKTTLVNLIPNPLFILDKDGNFIDVNISFEDFFGLKKDEIFKGNNFEILMFLKIMRADLFLENAKKLNGKNKYITELDLIYKNGNIRRVKIYKSFLHKKGKLTGLIGIIFDITEQVSTIEKLYNQSIKDELTGAFNRRYFYHIFPIEKERAFRNNYKISLIMFDIDFFKKINDTFGHQTGDNVLKELSELVKNNIRKYDYLFRVGGEEFVILLIKSDSNKSFNIAEKLRKTVESHNFDERFQITISLGVTEIKKDDSLDKAIKRADAALYNAKNKGRNRTERG